MDSPQAIHDAETEPFDDGSHWARTVYGSIALEEDGLWVHSASKSGVRDEIDLIDPDTIHL